MEKIEDITLLKNIGNGTFGAVYLSKKDGRSEYFATKVLSRDIMDIPDKKKYLQNEIQILKELKHPNICKLEEVKETQEYYLLVMEYINGGSLSKCFDQYKEKYKVSAFPEIIVQRIMKQIISAFKFIHSKNIMHRDITLENIMVNYTNQKDKDDINLLNAQIKIIDFGVAIKGFGKNVIGRNCKGLFPILKETIEVYYSQVLIKILFTTTSFSLGLNVPTRTVVSTYIYKFNDSCKEILCSSEYLQMYGRVGRKSIDEIEVFILLTK